MQPVPSRGPVVALLLLLVAYGLLAMTLCLPSMPDWARSFDATPAQVQLSFGGYLLAYGALQLLHGPLSDRLGRRPVVVAGLVVAAAGSVAAALAPGLTALVLARVLQGAGAAAGLVVGRALVNDHFDGSERTRMMAWVGMAMGLTPPLGTIVGGQLHVALGWRANFWVLAVLALALALACWRWLPRARPAAAGPRPGLLAGYGRLAREPGFAVHAFALGLTTGTFYMFLAGAPLVLGHAGVGPDRMGFFIAFVPVSFIVGNALSTQLVRRLGDAGLMRWGQRLNLLALAAVVGLALAGRQHPLAFVGPLVLLGVGHGLLLPPTLARTVGRVPALAGAASAVGGLLQQLTGAVGAWLVGLLPHHSAAPLGLLMLCSTAGVSLLLVHALRR